RLDPTKLLSEEVARLAEWARPSIAMSVDGDAVKHDDDDDDDPEAQHARKKRNKKQD
ncbi:MAG: hypothetical protein IV100_28835, partial [Myxococcales bacterium]|nr:hypothetical protein [Myxococcales bacterium]